MSSFNYKHFFSVKWMVGMKLILLGVFLLLCSYGVVLLLYSFFLVPSLLFFTCKHFKRIGDKKVWLPPRERMSGRHSFSLNEFPTKCSKSGWLSQRSFSNLRYSFVYHSFYLSLFFYSWLLSLLETISIYLYK